MDLAIEIIQREINQRKLALTIRNLRMAEIQAELDSLEKALANIKVLDALNKNS